MPCAAAITSCTSWGTVRSTPTRGMARSPWSTTGVRPTGSRAATWPAGSSTAAPSASSCSMRATRPMIPAHSPSLAWLPLSSTAVSRPRSPCDAPSPTVSRSTSPRLSTAVSPKAAPSTPLFRAHGRSWRSSSPRKTIGRRLRSLPTPMKSSIFLRI